MNLSLINLFLAVIWLAGAAVLFVLLQMNIIQANTLVRYDILCFVLGLYNLVRWWSSRVAQDQRRQGEQVLRRPSLRRASDDLPAPDPNFIFTDPPPKRGDDPA